MTQENQIAPAFIYDVVCVGANGTEKWRESVHNLVTTAGKTDLINQYFKASAYTAAWYLGLMGAGAPTITDTLSSHSGWSEIMPYSGSRFALTFGTPSAGSCTANAVSISINTTATIYGSFITNAASGNSGILYSASSFSVTRGVASGDTLSVTPTVSVS